MLRRAVAIFVLILACATARAQELAVIPPLTGPVVDTTSTLDAASREQLQAQALDLRHRKGSQLQILIVPSTAPEDIAQYAQRVFEAWKLGRKGIDDGVLLVVARDDHAVRIQTGYGLEGAIPDATAARVIQEYLLPRFRDGQYTAGIVEGSAVLVRLIDGESLPKPGRSWPWAAVAIVACFAAVFLVVPIAGMLAAWRRGRSGFLVRLGLVLVVLGAGYAWARDLLAPGEWIPVAALGYMATTFIFMTALGGRSRGSGHGSGLGSDSSSDSGSSSSADWSGDGGDSGGGGASGSW